MYYNVIAVDLNVNYWCKLLSSRQLRISTNQHLIHFHCMKLNNLAKYLTIYFFFYNIFFYLIFFLWHRWSLNKRITFHFRGSIGLQLLSDNFVWISYFLYIIINSIYLIVIALHRYSETVCSFIEQYFS